MVISDVSYASFFPSPYGSPLFDIKKYMYEEIIDNESHRLWLKEILTEFEPLQVVGIGVDALSVAP